MSTTVSTEDAEKQFDNVEQFKPYLRYADAPEQAGERAKAAGWIDKVGAHHRRSTTTLNTAPLDSGAAAAPDPFANRHSDHGQPSHQRT